METLIVLLILVVFVFVVVGFPNKAFAQLKDVVQGFKNVLPPVTVGEKEIAADKPTLQNPQRQQEIKNLQKTIATMMNSEKKYCFASYGGFIPFKEGETSISLGYDQKNDETSFTIRGGIEGRQVLRDVGFTIKGMVPCVIGGSKAITHNFELSFLNYLPWKDKEVVLNHYNPVASILINHEGINYSLGSLDLNDAGYLYTPDNRHICFFPTVAGFVTCKGDSQEGLDDDCLGEGADWEVSIPSQLKKGTLQSC